MPDARVIAGPSSRPSVRLLPIFFLTILLTLAPVVPSPVVDARAAAPPGPALEVRALWVLRTSLTSPASIERVVQTARASGFNTLIAQVRGRGDAYYQSSLEPRAAALGDTPAGFDPLAVLLTHARRAGLRVHAWINVNLVASATDPGTHPLHVARRAPAWLMVPRELAADLYAIDPRDPRYVSRLAAWARDHSSRVEGLYASPLHPGAVDHAAAVVRDLVTRYPVDGVHLDYVRYPDDDFDYSRAALERFRQSVMGELPSPDRARLDARLAREPLVYAETFPVRWASFRRAALTGLVMRLRTTVKAVRPEAVLSAAVYPMPEEATTRKLQDWSAWLENGLLDVACPMAYTTDPGTFALQIGSATRLVTPGAVWAGIGAYRLTPAQTVSHIELARRAGSSGIVLFSYDSVTGDGPGGDTFLRQVSRDAFTDALPTAQAR